MLRLGNQTIRLLEGLWERFERFLARRYTLLKWLQRFHGDAIMRRQPPDGFHPTRALFQIIFEWSKKEKPLIVFFLIG